MEILNLFLVFIEGVLSLFSPCVIPMIPIYLGMLSNSSINSLKDGEVRFLNSSLFKNTVSFVFGISTTFFILGTSASLINMLFTEYKGTILVIGGIIIVIMGIFYMDLIKIPLLQKQKKINIEVKEMKPITAYILGFAFSFGWTPCIGPMLSSILIMASTSDSVLTGNILILVYTIGFTIPFILIAIFYNKLFKYLDKIKLHLNLIKKIGGAILIITGIIMILGGPDKTYENFKKAVSNSVESIENKSTDKKENKTTNNKKLAADFTLVDQYGTIHKLSDYKGKVVFLNFWATWCPPCRGEMPDIEAIYKEYSSDEVVILGVATPNLGQEGTQDEIVTFLSKNKYTFPVVFDIKGEVIEKYNISAFPTTFIIDKEGYIIKKVPGAMKKETMKSLIDKIK